MLEIQKFIQRRWNLFNQPEPPGFGAGPMTFGRPGMSSRRYFSSKSIEAAILTRIAVDVSTVYFYHAKLDRPGGTPQEMLDTKLNRCLTLSANIDQSAQAFLLDAALTMMQEGEVALVPTDFLDIENAPISDTITAWRVGRVVGRHPRRVRVEVYDDRETDSRGEPVGGGIRRQVTVSKESIAIVENPFFTIMNEPNGTFQRLKRKLELLDGLDEESAASKLDIIFQLPYAVRSDQRKKEAEERYERLMSQLRESELGVGYVDVNEKVIQLNRSIDNNLLPRIEMLQAQLYSELGLTPEIMNGTADRATINNYYDRTVEPIATALALEMKRKFLTDNAITRGQSIEIYRDPLKLIPMEELAEVADKLIRNAVVTANEFRPKIGFMPSSDPRANELANPNMPVEDQPQAKEGGTDDAKLPSGVSEPTSRAEALRSEGDEVGDS